MKNVVVYERVSSKEQSVESQHKAIVEYCQSKNYNILKIFAENISGIIEEREELINLFDYVEDNPPDAVVVMELSRFGRDNAEFQLNVRRLIRKKINFISIKENISILDKNGLKDANQQLIAGFQSAFAEYERTSIISRTMRGRLSRKANGGWIAGYGPNAFPLGMEVEKGKMSDGKGILKLNGNETEINTVRRIFELYLSGNGCKKIRKALTDEGYKGKLGGLISFNSIYNTIKNPNYVKFGVINQDDYDKANKIKKEKYHVKVSRSATVYILPSNKYICAVCGQHLRFCVHSTQKDKKRVYCDRHVNMNYDSVINAVYYCIRRTDHFYTFINKLKENDENEKNIKILSKEIEKLKIQIKKCNERKNNLNDLYIEGNITKEKYSEKFKENELLLKNILKIVGEKIDELNLIKSTIRDFSDDEIIKRMKSSPDEAKELINFIVAKLVCYSSDFYIDRADKKFKIVQLYTNFNKEEYISFMFNNQGYFCFIDENDFDFSTYKMKTEVFGERLKEIIFHLK